MFKGQIYNRKMNVLGELSNDCGQIIYEGGFKDNIFDGFGVLFNRNKTQSQKSNYNDLNKNLNNWENYQGLFKNNLRNGIGFINFNNGD